LKITKNHFFGFEFYGGDYKSNYGALINYFQPNDKPHSDLIELTKGIHHFVQIGPSYSLCLRAERVFIKSIISGGPHKIRQQQQVINYYPVDTSTYSKKIFMTDKFKHKPSGWKFYGALQFEFGYRFKTKNYHNTIATWSIGARYMYGVASVKSTYYEQFDDGKPVNHIHYSDRYISRNLDYHVYVTLIF